MSGPLTVDDGTLITKDPADSRVWEFDWDEHLSSTASISTSTFTITAISPSADTALTKDNPSIVLGNRQTQVRIIGGTLGAKYRLDNTIVTDETPAQTIERSVFVKIENK